MSQTSRLHFESLALGLVLISSLSLRALAVDCSAFNYCNGHGRCLGNADKCECFEGWGAASDVTYYRAPDCSKRTCPAGKAWADVPLVDKTAHRLAECSNRGTCDRSFGQCKCFEGFTGDACNRNKCPNDCSGHGQCLSMRQLARLDAALPLAPNTYYEGEEDSITWDEDMSYGCLCDSSWPVGLGSGQTQVPEWFGPDCSKRRCPSADDLNTATNETMCHGKLAPGSLYTGKSGNLCYVECSNRGKCDYKTGLCHCFDGHYGADCTKRDVLAKFQPIR